jgi:hypothetical protein
MTAMRHTVLSSIDDFVFFLAIELVLAASGTVSRAQRETDSLMVIACIADC